MSEHPMKNTFKRNSRIFMLVPLLAVLGACSQSDESTTEQTESAVTQTTVVSADGPPRLEDGTVNLGPPPGSMGFWTANNGRLVNDPNNYEAARREMNSRVNIEDAPLQP